MKRLADVSIFLEGTENTGMVFYGVDLVNFWNALDSNPNSVDYEPFLCLRDEDGNDVCINISKIDFVRIKKKD